MVWFQPRFQQFFFNKSPSDSRISPGKILSDSSKITLKRAPFELFSYNQLGSFTKFSFVFPTSQFPTYDQGLSEFLKIRRCEVQVEKFFRFCTYDNVNMLQRSVIPNRGSRATEISEERKMLGRSANVFRIDYLRDQYLQYRYVEKSVVCNPWLPSMQIS